MSIFGWIMVSCGSVLGTTGCVTPRQPEELLDLDHRSPEQTFRSFQFAMAGDLPRMEFRCFSKAFREENGLSEMVYGTARDEFLGSWPWLRGALTEAEIQSVDVSPQGRSARILARSLGTTLAVDLVREDFYEIRTKERLLDYGYEPLHARDQGLIQAYPDRQDAFYLAFTLPEGSRIEDVTEVLVAGQWKIDAIDRVSGADQSPPSRSTESRTASDSGYD